MPSKTRRGAEKPHGRHRRTEKFHTKPRPRPTVDREVMEHEAAPLPHPRGHCVPARVAHDAPIWRAPGARDG